MPVPVVRYSSSPRWHTHWKKKKKKKQEKEKEEVVKKNKKKTEEKESVKQCFLACGSVCQIAVGSLEPFSSHGEHGEPITK